MPAFLKIENIGVCPPEGFTVLGVSLADTSNHEGVIGQFGSGNKHAVAVLLRNGLVAGRLRRHAASWSSPPARRPWPTARPARNLPVSS